MTDEQIDELFNRAKAQTSEPFDPNSEIMTQGHQIGVNDADFVERGKKLQQKERSEFDILLKDRSERLLKYMKEVRNDSPTKDRLKSIRVSLLDTIAFLTHEKDKTRYHDTQFNIPGFLDPQVFKDNKKRETNRIIEQYKTLTGSVEARIDLQEPIQAGFGVKNYTAGQNTVCVAGNLWNIEEHAKTEIQIIKQKVFDCLHPLSGSFKKGRKLSESDFNCIVSEVVYLVENKTLPIKINKISRSDFPIQFIRKIFYNTFNEFSSKKNPALRELWVDFLHQSFEQMVDSDRKTTLKKFSQYKGNFESDLTLIEHN